MENNTIRPASQQQINYLKKLGYTGNTEGLTNAEASAYIQQMVNNQPTPHPQQSADYYNQPQQAQYQAYSQPHPQQAYQPSVQVTDSFNITTRQGETFALDRGIVDQYIAKGLTDQEYKYFFSVCKTLGLNPFLRDIYAIKFGSSPAQFVIDYKVLQQCADEQASYNGMKTGLLVAVNGVVTEREGAYLLPNEILIGAYCEVYRKDRTFPTKAYAMFNEVCKYKDGQPSGTWKEKPVFMNVKVAKAWALREAFPNMFSNNTYTSDEIEVIDNTDPERQYKNKASVETNQRNESASVTPDFEV